MVSGISLSKLTLDTEFHFFEKIKEDDIAMPFGLAMTVYIAYLLIIGYWNLFDI